MQPEALKIIPFVFSRRIYTNDSGTTATEGELDDLFKGNALALET